MRIIKLSGLCPSKKRRETKQLKCLAKPNLTLNWDEQMDKNINYCIEGI
jgi:hypothetical protein